jgi:DNA-binding PadR family transcriptional regulator
MSLSPSEMLFVKMVGKYGALSPIDIYRKLKKEKGCIGLVPTYPQAIYEAKNRLRKWGYIEKVKEKKVKAIPEEFYDLTEKGRQKFAELDRFYLPLIAYIPNFEDVPCEECNRFQECWENSFKILNETFGDLFGRTPIYQKDKIKERFRKPTRLEELTFWLRMLKIPQKILKEKFEPILTELGIDVERTFSEEISSRKK